MDTASKDPLVSLTIRQFERLQLETPLQAFNDKLESLAEPEES